MKISVALWVYSSTWAAPSVQKGNHSGYFGSNRLFITNLEKSENTCCCKISSTWSWNQAPSLPEHQQRMDCKILSQQQSIMQCSGFRQPIRDMKTSVCLNMCYFKTDKSTIVCQYKWFKHRSMQFIRAHSGNTVCVPTYEWSDSSTLTELMACNNVCESGPINILPNTEKLINQHSERHTAKCYLQSYTALTAAVNVGFLLRLMDDVL